jgi:hypothetical protein
MGSCFAQLAGDHIARDLGADQQDALPFYFSFQAADHGFGDIFLGHDVDLYAALFDGFSCGGADRRDAEAVGVTG